MSSLNPGENLVEKMLASPIPPMAGNVAVFDGYVRDIDAAREIAGEEQAPLLEERRAEAGELIGKLSSRRRFIFDRGELIGTNGYTAEQHYLINDLYFVKTPDADAKRERLVDLMLEDPRAYLMASVVMSSAIKEKIIGEPRRIDYQGLRTSFEEKLAEKPADELAAWLGSYLDGEAAVKQDIARDGKLSTLDIFQTNILDLLYSRVVHSVVGELNPELDLEYVYSLTKELNKVGNRQRHIRPQLEVLTADLVRIAIIKASLADDNPMVPSAAESAQGKLEALLARYSELGRISGTSNIKLARVLTMPEIPGRENAMWN